MNEPVRIALIGHGTVGQGVRKILRANRDAIAARVGAPVEVAAICDIRPVPGRLYVRDWHELMARQDIDIIVELVGGYEPARTMILESIKAGKHVVTANKAVLAKHWDEVFSRARARSRLVYFEAAVGGTIPVIQGINEGLAANRIQKIKGILNGTTNYILSAMTSQGLAYPKALEQARRAGFAEADPSFDVDGIDTAHKLAILSSLAWSCWVRLEDISVQGITGVTPQDIRFARSFGYVIKLIGAAVATPAGLELSVEPRLVRSSHAFATIDREYNAVLVQGDSSGDVMFTGRGAGQLPAASAVVADIISLAREVSNGTAGRVPYVTAGPRARVRVCPPARIQGLFYLRFIAQDRPGVLARVAGILGSCGVSIASVFQQERPAVRRTGAPIVMLTHRAAQGDLARAFRRISALDIVKAPPVCLRIEE